MDRKTLEDLEKIIRFLDKFTVIPFFVGIIINLLFFFEIFINPSEWIRLVSINLLGAAIAYLLYSYNKKYISKHIQEKEYDDIFMDSLCWGILGCIFYGTGVILLIQGIFILIYVALEKNFDKKEFNIKFDSKEFCRKLKTSLDLLAARAGFVIILIGLYIAEFIKLVNAIEKLLVANFNEIFTPIIIILIISILIMVSELETEDFYNHNEEFEHNNIIRVMIKGTIGCFFYFAGFFILMKGVVYAIIAIYEEEENKSSKKLKLIPELVVYSNT